MKPWKNWRPMHRITTSRLAISAPGLVPTHVTFGLAEKFGFEFGSDAAYDNLDCNTLASGDVDVMNSVAGLVQPCLDDLKVLATVTSERISADPRRPNRG